MDDLISVSTASFTLAGAVYGGFRKVDSLATNELKTTIYEWVQAKPQSTFQSVVLRDIPLVKGIKPPDALSNLLYTLIIFLVLLFAFNVGYSVFGASGILTAETGDVGLGINQAHLNERIEKYAGFLRQFSVDPQAVSSIFLVMVIVSVINLIPSHVNLLISRITAKLASIYAVQLDRLFIIYGADLLAKVVLTIFIAVMGMSLLAIFIDGTGIFETTKLYAVKWLQAVSFNREQTAIQAAFYSALYINAWFIICYLTMLITRVLYLFSVGRHALRYLKVREQPFTVFGTLCSAGLVVMLFAGYAVT